MLLEEADLRVVLDERRKPGLTEQFPAVSGRVDRKRRISTDSGVSLPRTPASAVPYREAMPRTGSTMPARRATSVRHSSLNTSPAVTSLMFQSAQGRSSVSMTFLRNGG